MLEHCDYELASRIIKEKFTSDEDPSCESSQEIHEYIANPCFKNAVKLIENDPLFTYYFVESKPGGLYTRMNGKGAQSEPKQEGKTAIQTQVAQKEVRNSYEQSAASVMPETPPVRAVNKPVENKPQRKQEFTNVISTLQFDIEQLQEQIIYFEKKLRGNHTEDQAERLEYNKMINMYRDGVAEFRAAVDILRKHNRNNLDAN